MHRAKWEYRDSGFATANTVSRADIPNLIPFLFLASPLAFHSLLMTEFNYGERVYRGWHIHRHTHISAMFAQTHAPAGCHLADTILCMSDIDVRRFFHSNNFLCLLPSVYDIWKKLENSRKPLMLYANNGGLLYITKSRKLRDKIHLVFFLFNPLTRIFSCLFYIITRRSWNLCLNASCCILASIFSI